MLVDETKKAIYDQIILADIDTQHHLNEYLKTKSKLEHNAYKTCETELKCLLKLIDKLGWLGFYENYINDLDTKKEIMELKDCYNFHYHTMQFVH